MIDKKYKLEIKHNEKLAHIWSIFAIKVGIVISGLIILWQLTTGNGVMFR